MRIIPNRRGEYLQILEEFEAVGGAGKTIYMVVLYNSDVMVYHQQSGQLWSKEDFFEYKEELKLATWRNPNLKEDRIRLFDKIFNSLIGFERDFKIEGVLRDENEHQYWLC